MAHLTGGNHLGAFEHGESRSGGQQVQFIDAWHQIWKLCEIYFCIQNAFKNVLVGLFAIYVLNLCTEDASWSSNFLDHD